MFGKGGALDNKMPPDAKSQSLNERLAARLTQQSLYSPDNSVIKASLQVATI